MHHANKRATISCDIQEVALHLTKVVRKYLYIFISPTKTKHPAEKSPAEAQSLMILAGGSTAKYMQVPLHGHITENMHGAMMSNL